MHHLRILHLSDLHECAEFADISDERRDLVRSQAGSRNRVLGISFLEILRTINSKGKIDLICFTGDVADWGLNEEYRQATTLFNNILKTTGVSKERIFVVPGNHDINRKTSEEAWNKMRLWGKRNPDRLSEWMMASSKKCPEGAILTWREEIQKRSANFWSWVSNDLQREKLVPRKNPHSRLGYQVKINDLGFPFDIHVIGIDSAWLAGDDDDTSYLQITENQVDMLTRDNGILLPGLKLVLVHHPLKNLLDGDRSFRLLADSVNLLLHGHQHDEIIETQINPDRKLYCFAAGCIYESEKYINSFHVLDILLNDNGEPLKYDIDFWGWSAKGYWCLTGMFFKAAPNGHYSTKTELGEKTLPPDKIEIKVIGKKRRNEDDFFDERFQDRIEQRAKTNTLLTIDEKILICIYGYPGMGKTTLVEKVLWEIEKGKYPDNVLQNKWDGILYLQKEELKFDILFDRIKSLSPYEMQQELELIKRACQELDKKIIILLEVLKKERIIILLDGADDLFDENGKFKKECEDFKLFCKLALKNNIASKILITSNKFLEFYDEFSEEFDENFINEHTHTEELNEGLPKEFALSYLRALDESGRSGLKNATDDQLSRIAKITYGISRVF